MQKETIELSFDYDKAGIRDIGDRATLDCCVPFYRLI